MSVYTPEALTAKQAEYRYRKEHQLCVDCAAGLQEDDGVRCLECTAREVESRRRALRRPGRREEIAANSAKWMKAEYARRKSIGQCVRCAKKATRGVHCDRHADIEIAKSAKRAARKRRGILQFPKKKRMPTKRINRGLTEIASYQPLDEIEQKPRVRILLALSWFEWVTSLEIWEALGIDMSDGSIEHNTYAQSLSMLCRKYGCVEKRGERGTYKYRITDAGRAEASAFRNGEVGSRARRAA